MTEVAEASVPLWAKCSKCAHIWAAAYYPMNLEKFAKIVSGHASCPKCGEPGVVAKQNNGRLLDPDDQATAF